MKPRIAHINPKHQRLASAGLTLTGYEIRIHTKIHQGSVIWHGLIAHEMTHWDQFKRTWGLHNIYRLLSKKYLLEAELEAYANQAIYLIGHGEDRVATLNRFARFLHSAYGLDVTEKKALSLLKDKINKTK
jgi:hypothetical protein